MRMVQTHSVVLNIKKSSRMNNNNAMRMVETLQLTYDVQKNSHSMQFKKIVIITIQLTKAYNGPSILIAQ